MRCKRQFQMTDPVVLQRVNYRVTYNRKRRCRATFATGANADWKFWRWNLADIGLD